MTRAQSKRHLLVVEDDVDFANVLEKILRQENYDVIVCPDAESARRSLVQRSFDAVISDIRLPSGGSGVDLLHFIKKSAAVPVILMTGFAELVETIEAASLGADGFLPKPFKKEEILSLLNGLFEGESTPPGQPVEGGEADLDQHYFKMSLDDFVSGKEILFEIFVRLSSQKYVKLANQGESLTPERIKLYKGKGIQFLYLTKEDFKKYVGMNAAIASSVAKSRKVEKQRKLDFMRHTSDILLQKVFLEGVNKESFQQAKAIAESTVSLLSDEASFFQLLESLNTHMDHLYAHSLGVSLHATMIAKEMKWLSSSTLFKVSIGGLLHDIGKKEIPRAILEKNKRDYTQEEIKLYETHPARGMEILSLVAGISGDILQIIAQHHENRQGRGFPLKLPEKKIHPLAKIVHVANEFCRLTLKNPDSNGVTPREAVKQMILFVERYDKAAFLALLRIFDIPAPEGLAPKTTG